MVFYSTACLMGPIWTCASATMGLPVLEKSTNTTLAKIGVADRNAARAAFGRVSLLNSVDPVLSRRGPKAGRSEWTGDEGHFTSQWPQAGQSSEFLERTAALYRGGA